ncbi:Methyltransferase domain-containing protein [Nocardia amikacinitolerans]|uniref:class I SAM-dependent methyltransferase n=1 Tax=Nocardia amikacinitolerans TaxID=756689 RepID=UPI00082D8112|nr:class I SAM-dependent methyltransferase [Nocardia amikacinitolerans]MCP2317756.1 Methyltransferase domain-containing protein [Nocardia amikacinitolerans]
MTAHDQGPVLLSENLLTDNPALYERTFPDTGERNARFVADLVARFGVGALDDLLDVGSGTGRDAARLTELGYRARGVDISPRMVEYARIRYPAVDFSVGDARTLRAETPVDVLTCLGSTLLHLHDTAEIVAALDRFAACLRIGGLLILEMRNGAFLLTDRGRRELLDEEIVRRVDWEGVAYTSRTSLTVDLPAQLLRRQRTWTWPGCPEPVVQHTAWRLLFPQELRHLLTGAGFEVLALFDAPGPLTTPRWPADGVLSERLDGDRVHVVARRTGSGPR